MRLETWIALTVGAHTIQAAITLQKPFITEGYHRPIDLTNDVTLTFDDLPEPSEGISSLPNPYPDSSFPLSLRFNGLSLFRPDHPKLSHLISTNDLNCAVSLPYAVLGSRYQVSPDPATHHAPDDLKNALRPASFEVPPSDDSAKMLGDKTFELMSLSIKPMDFPEGAETVIFLRGHYSNFEEIMFNISFPAGYHLPLHLDMSKVSTDKAWANLRKVEIWADYGRDDKSGYEGLDWEYCIDNLMLST